MKVVTFDFDNTIAMSHVDLSSGDVKYVFDGYNKPIINLIKQYINDNYDVHIVTSRFEANQGTFPDDTVKRHLDKLSLSAYFWPDKVHYTNGSLKGQKLKELGSTLHYDDDMEEHIDNFGGITIKNPYESFKDTEYVAKCIVYDSSNHILLLKRTDEGTKWDIPGGHLKDIEVKRGEIGFEEGLEREVAEETGLILPFSKEIGLTNFAFKGKKSKITVFMSKFGVSTPKVNLNIQDHQENSEYKWVSLEEIDEYAQNGTQVMQKAVEFAKKHGILSEKASYQAKMKRKHRKMKRKLVGMGGNSHFGGGKGHKRPKMNRSKSAPAGFGALEEDNKDKKRTIKVKIVQKVHKAAVIKGNPAHLVKNKAISDKFYNEIGQILKNEGFLVDFHDSKAHWWPGKPKKMVYDLWIGHSLGADRLEGAIDDGYTRKVIGFGVPSPEKQPFLAINHPKDKSKPGKVSGNEHYMLSNDMKMALKDTISAIKGAKLDEKRRKKRKKGSKKGSKKGKFFPYGGSFPHHGHSNSDDGGDGGGGE